jgi:hypothetical protein
MRWWRRLLELVSANPLHDIGVLWSSRGFTKLQDPVTSQEWLAVCFKLSDSQFGTAEERDAAHRFSDQLAAAIEAHSVGKFDGDEFGNGEGVLFMCGPNADELFDAVYPTLKTWEPLKGGHVIKRYGQKANRERIDF